MMIKAAPVPSNHNDMYNIRKEILRLQGGTWKQWKSLFGWKMSPTAQSAVDTLFNHAIGHFKRRMPKACHHNVQFHFYDRKYVYNPTTKSEMWFTYSVKVEE